MEDHFAKPQSINDRAGLRSDDICRAIDALAVHEDYSSFTGRLVGSKDCRPSVPADALLDASMRTAIEARFARRFDDFDPRAVHSIWMKYYVNACLPPLLLADLLLLQTVAVPLDATRFILGDDLLVAAIKIARDSWDSSCSDPFDRFSDLIFGHFQPLIERWSACTNVTPRVFWSNVGNTFEAMLRRVEAVSGSSQRLEQAWSLLIEALWSDGRPNPLFDAIHYVTQGGISVRRRRICCLQYLLPDRRYCKACPIEEPRPISGMLIEPE